MLRAFKYRIYPNKTQKTSLEEMLRDFCDLYNAALQQRVEAYSRQGKALTFFDQTGEIKALRHSVSEFSKWSFNAKNFVLKRVDKSFKAFFRRVKVGKNPGFPRFKSKERYRSADFSVGDGLTIRDNGKIGIVGVPGGVKVKWHRKMPNKPKFGTIFCKAGIWHVAFCVDVDVVERSGPDSVGIDFGLNSLVALSSGETINRQNWTKKAERGLRRRQRALARCEPGSATRKKRVNEIQRYHMKISNRRNDMLHKVSRGLVDRYGRIAIENLNIQGMARGWLSKPIHDASWAKLTKMINYKAESAGVDVVCVDARYTSQTCPACGTVKAKALSQRKHVCECGCDLDRDVAAAIVVHQRAFGFTPGTGDGSLSVPTAAKLGSEVVTNLCDGSLTYYASDKIGEMTND